MPPRHLNDYDLKPYALGRLAKADTPTAEEHLVVPGLRAGHYLCLFGMHVLTPCVMDLLGEAIAAAARELVRLRDGWLNPPGLAPEELSKRTLTNLYNTRPAWLEHAHAALARAVVAAYGWPADLPVEDLLARLLALNLERDPVPQKGTP